MPSACGFSLGAPTTLVLGLISSASCLDLEGETFFQSHHDALDRQANDVAD